MNRVPFNTAILAAIATAALLAGDIAPTQAGLAYKQPQMVSAGRQVGLVFGSENTIYFSISTDDGRTFGAPLPVATAPTLSLGNHRGPRVAFTGGAIIITAGTSSPKGEYGPNTLHSWRSTDGGKTWLPGPAISAPESAGMGFHALASDGKQGLWSVWLGPEEGKLKLFGAHSVDAGVTWSKPRIIYESPDGGVCECCHPSVTIARDGNILVMFRNSLKGSRDLYLATSKDAGQSFAVTKLGQGTWPINACPMDGGGLAEFNGRAVTVWRRQSDLFIARPDGKPEESLGAGKNPAVAFNEKGVYAVWSSAQGLMAKTPSRAEPYVLAKSGAFPSITAQGAAVVAWEDNGVIHTHLLQ